MVIVTVYNGDTSEWVRLDIASEPEGTIVINLIRLTLSGNVKRFDFKKKCWYIHTDVIEQLLTGIKVLMKEQMPTHFLDSDIIEDKRIKLEDFDSFFNSASEVRPDSPLDKKSLLREFEHICKDQALVMVSIREDAEVKELKPYYRKAALALHPDRNNGDGSKMSQLNMIWAQLQQLG